MNSLKLNSLKPNNLKLSLEFTSPAHPMAEHTIMQAATALCKHQTDYSFVNFGGDTISPDRAIMVMKKLQSQFNMPTIGYLRRLYIDKTQFNKIAEEYHMMGIKKIFLSQGRRLGITSTSQNDYPNLAEAIKAIRKIADFELIVEARPEHNSAEIDDVHELIDLGINEIVTRFSFNPATTLRFLDKLSEKSTLPKIRIGAIAVENPSKTFLTAHRLNVSIPDYLNKIFAQYPDDDQVNTAIGIHILLEQIKEYMQYGYYDFHIRFGKSSYPIDALCRYFNVPAEQEVSLLHSQAV